MNRFPIALLFICGITGCDTRVVVSNGECDNLYADVEALGDNTYNVAIWEKYHVTEFCSPSNGGSGCNTYVERESVTDTPEIRIFDGSAEIELGRCGTLCLIVKPESADFLLELDFDGFGLDDAWMWSTIDPG